jgi:hypothetical protein
MVVSRFQEALMASGSAYISQAILETAIGKRERQRDGRARRNGIIWSVVLAVAGLILVLLGVLHGNGAPTCGGAPMQSGDTCQISANDGSSGNYTYQQMQQQQASSAGGEELAGWVFVAAGGLLVVHVLRKRSPSKPWGKPLDTECPRCHKPDLQERRTSRRITTNGVGRKYKGLVTLCTPECGFVAVTRL